MLPSALTPAAEQERLVELARYGVLGTPAEDAYTRIARIAQQALGTTGALIGFLGEKRVHYKAQLGVSVGSYPRSQALCTFVALGGRPLVVADARSVPSFADLALVQQNEVRFYAGVPLLTGTGTPLGALCVFDTLPREPDRAQMELLTDLSETVLELLRVRRRNLEAQAAPQQLRVREARLQLGELLEHAPYFALTAKSDGTLSYANETLKTALGFDPLPKKLRDLYPVEARPALAATLGTALTAGQASLDTTLLTRSGDPIPVSQLMRLHSAADPPMGGGQASVSVLARDLRVERQRDAFEARRAEVLELTARGAPLPAVLLRLTQFLEATCPGLTAAVSLLREDRLQLEVAPGLPSAFARVLGSLPVGPEAGACALAAHTGVRVVTPDIRRDPHWQNLRYFALQNGIQACWSEPILSDQGGVLGTFALYAREARSPQEPELRLLREAAQLAAIAVSRRDLYRQLEHSAHYDTLTGLPNRLLLQEYLARAVGLVQAQGGQEGCVGVFLLDLDNFKQVNDSLGHSAGDGLLREVAGRLQACLPPGASVARSGGDEFVFIVPLTHRDDATRFAFEITGALKGPFVIQGRSFRIAASIGVSLAPDDGATPEALLKAADSAMYAAKADTTASRQGYRRYQSAMTEALEAQLRLEADFRRALAGDELRLFVQPRFDIAARRTTAFEALVRWQHPEAGLLTPDAFLGTAQKAGLLPQLDAWVLRRVVEQLGVWRAAGQSEGLSCNVSAASFQGVFLDLLAASLGEHQDLAARLELEVTESLLMRDLEGTAAQLRALKGRFPALRIAIDDFGSGYSSLAYLRYLPIDTLKIDRAFVKDLDHSDGTLQRTALAVIRTVIALGRDLDFRIVAEGAETDAQVGMLTALGVDEVQGYALGKPQPLTEIVLGAPSRACSVPRGQHS